jgi:hypothetical protein
MEGNPTPESPIVLKFSNRSLELPLLRTSAYTYRGLGQRAISHLWIENEIQPEDGRYMGTRVWFDQFGHNEEEKLEYFNTTLQAMLNYDYEMHLNLPEPQENDMESFILFQTRGTDRIPDGWD